jgi:hypothetical protein
VDVAGIIPREKFLHPGWLLASPNAMHGECPFPPFPLVGGNVHLSYPRQYNDIFRQPRVNIANKFMITCLNFGKIVFHLYRLSNYFVAINYLSLCKFDAKKSKKH